ncbi:MAG: DUF4258 domain-containing protein [Armatimonadota bacterium]|nr:DUF4258 domain-containing protein [Armatimonadota bacterium]
MLKAVTRDSIRAALQSGQWAMTHHARERAGQRCISDAELVPALINGELLEVRPKYPGGPRGLVLGYTDDGRPVHVSCTFDPGGDLVIVTAYVPEPPYWLDERTRGLKEPPK